MTRVLIVAEHDNKSLHPGTAKSVTCAAGIVSDGIDLAVLAANAEALCTEAAAIAGVNRVLKIERAENSAPVAAILAPQIAELATDYSHLLGPSTTFGKDLMPRVAALLGVAQVSDIMASNGPHEFQRPVYAGNAIVTVAAQPDRTVVGTVRIASFAAAPAGGSATIEEVSTTTVLPEHTEYVGQASGDSDRPDLQTAARVVAGGRALGSEQNFELICQLADKLGAGVGATRAAVDAGYVPNEFQVGQTGKIIAPELYIAVGISGAIQHLTGIKDAGTIVAINKDPEAPIFEVADFGLVGDLFQLVPELINKLK